jgi:hypothetical protein
MSIAIDGTGGYVNNSSSASVNLSLSTSGAGIVILIVIANAAPTGATSTNLGTFSSLLAFQDTSNFITYYYAVSSGALSSENITVNLASSTFVTVIGQGVSGTSTSSILDADSPVTATIASTQHAITLSTVAVNTIIFMTAVASAAQFTPQSGFTQLQNSSGFNSTQYQIVSSPQSSLSIGTINFFGTMSALAITQASGISTYIPYDPWPQWSPLLAQKRKQSGWSPLFDHRRRVLRPSRQLLLPSRKLFFAARTKIAA